MRKMAPSEGKVALSMRGQVREPPHRLFEIRNMSGLYRPHDEMGRRQPFEPVALAVVDLLVDRRPDEALERLDALPHREVDRHGRIARGTDRRGVVALILEPPHESLAAL